MHDHAVARTQHVHGNSAGCGSRRRDAGWCSSTIEFAAIETRTANTGLRGEYAAYVGQQRWTAIDAGHASWQLTGNFVAAACGRQFRHRT